MSSPPKSGVREVLEAIGSSPGGMTQEKDAVALLDVHLGRVQECNESQDLAHLIDVRDGARRALDTTFKVRTESQLARSHADPLVNALAPLERLIENMQKEELAKPKAPKGQAPQGQQPKVEAVPIAAVDPVLPPARKGIRDAVKGGKLAELLKDPGFLKQTTDWMATADPKDADQRADMLAVLKDMDPALKELRQKAFEQTFNTKVAKSEERIYTPILDKKTGLPQIDPRTKLPRVFEGKPTAVPLNPAALTAMANVMAQLPTEHMPKAWSIEAHNQDKGTTGSYDDRTDEAIFRFSLTDVAEGLGQEYTNVADGDPLKGAKAFDVLIRHECGHKAAAVAKSDNLTDLPIAGAWVHHDTAENVLTAIDSEFQDLVKKIQKGGAAPTEQAIRKAVASPDNGFDAGAIAEALKIPPERVPDDHVVLRVLQQGFGSRFMCGSSPVSVGGRMFVVGGPGAGSWFSFAKASWENRVSFYQYAAPNEWFAEFYATANNGDANVRKAAKQRYPEAWNWMKKEGCIVFPD